MTEWAEQTDADRRALAAAGSTVFVDDLENMFVTEDCGGDLNFYIFNLDGTGHSFASLGPDEVRRLHAALADRIASYSVSP